MIRHLLVLASVLLAAQHGSAAPLAEAPANPAPTLYLIGDSTMANKANPDFPERGWGQLFARFIIPPAKLDNHALNGRSTKSFIREKHWSKVLHSLQPGDWVIIQFGHNDQKADKPKQYAAANGDYRDNLRRFITETRAKHAHPLIATPVVRRRWQDGSLVDTLGDYPAAARAVATEEQVPWLELHDLTIAMESGAGVEGSAKFHFTGDDTHYSETGALEVSKLAAAEIHRLKLPLMKWISTEPRSGGNPADRR